MAEAKQNPAEREITELERILEEKKRALAERGGKEEHKEIFREAFREKYGEAFRPPAPSPAAPGLHIPPPPAVPSRRFSAAAKEREDSLQTLIRLAFEKGVRKAADIAKRTSPWLLDELHDRLVDEYYQKLVQSKQIRE